MKKLLKVGLVLTTLVLAIVSSALVLYAAEDHGRPGAPRGRGRFGGEVTEVTNTAVTIVTYAHPTGNGPIHPHRPISHTHPLTPTHPLSQTQPITRVANFTDTTAVRLVECQCAGTLADITVGDHIDVRGVRLNNDTFVALTITIAPDGDKLGGKVTVVNGTTLSVMSRDALSGTIVTNETTKFLTRDGVATLADITVGKKIAAYGDAQADGSLLARVVLIQGGKGRGGMTAAASTSTFAAVDGADDMVITVDSAAIDALVNNLASNDDQPLEEAANQEVTVTARIFLPMLQR